ncbi:MAG: type II secretion system F family protein [Devosiaceae bacterium]|nr:type II secretion system F family protein [Devosiaceae bacterium]
MSPIVLGILIFICVGALGVAFVPSMAGSGRADKRIKALHGSALGKSADDKLSKGKEDRRRSMQQAVAEQLKNNGNKKKRIPLQAQLHQAGLKIDKAAFIRNSAILAIVIFVLCFIFGAPLLYAAVFAAAGGYLLPRWYLGHRKKKFQKAFLLELPNAVEAIVRGVKTGLPLNDSLRIVAKEAKEPVRSEFAHVIDAQSMGKATDEAVALIYERVPLSEVNFFVVVISVQQQAGGNLSEALTNLARVLRDRKKMQAKVKAMSSEAKASAMIIGSLPFIVAALVSFVTPDYLLPLVSSPMGYIMLGIATVMMSLGIFIMNRMIQFDY